jgi:hypothetical protein
MIAFHPDHFHAELGIGQLADVAEEFPVFLGQSAEVEVGKHIAQQDQPAKLGLLQKLQRIGCPADLGAQMQVRDDYGVRVLFLHAPLL